MDFAQTINYKIADLTTVHRVEMEKRLAPLGIHSGQIFIFFELWNRDGLSQVELASSLRLAPPTVNKMVKSLSDAGFVRMERSASDRRLVKVFLTEKGKSVRNEAEEIWKNFEADIVRHLTETERLIFLQLLEKILLYFYKNPSED
jgi:DNA-binding MarR family transcriptional regulator